MHWLLWALAITASAETARKGLNMLKLILGLLVSLPALEADVVGLINEVKDAPDGMSMLRNSLSAARKLVADLEKAVE